MPDLKCPVCMNEFYRKPNYIKSRQICIDDICCCRECSNIHKINMNKNKILSKLKYDITMEDLLRLLYVKRQYSIRQIVKLIGENVDGRTIRFWMDEYSIDRRQVILAFIFSQLF